MSRQLRIEFSGAWYHVMNRGVNRQTIFHSHEYFKLFLDNLACVHNEYKIEIHAYCLMSNHYHLLVRTQEPNLSKAMRQINGIFAQKHNALRKIDGPLFRGRYKAILVDADAYLLELNRYIHLNPVSAKIVDNPEDYPWSSYRHYINDRSKPDWLYCEQVLTYFKNKVDDYRSFVLKGNDPNTKCFLEDMPKIPILGSENFIEYTKNTYLPNLNLDASHEHSETPIKTLTIKDIVMAVSEHFNVNFHSVQFGFPNAKPNFPRKIAVYLAYKIIKINQEKIAKDFGGISRSQVAATCSNVEKMINENEATLIDINKIKSSLGVL